MPPSTSPAQPERPTPVRPGLREISGGYDITRWPIAVPPAQDEHVLSWIWRVAHRYGMSVNATLTALGVPGRPSSTRRVQVALEAHADLLTSRLGPTPLRLDTRSPTTGAEMLDKELHRYLVAYAIGRVPAPTFGYCPACLGQTGTWSRVWKTRLPGICATHEVFLLDNCPDCQQRPFTKPSWMSATTEPWACPNITTAGTQPRTVRGRCGADLRDARATPAPAGELASMTRLQDAARRSACYPVDRLTVCGFETTVEEYFDAVLELVDELIGVKRLLNADPPETSTLLDAISAAFTVLDQADAARAASVAKEHGLLAPQGRHTPIVTTHKVRRRRHNALLGAIRLRSLEPHLSPTAQLTFRTASLRPRYPQHFDGIPALSYATALPGQVALDWVPQLIWPGVLTAWISDVDFPARAAASMLLVKVGSTRPWSLIALDLGLPASFATTPSALVKRMRRTGSWMPFLRALDGLSTRLENHPPPINYSARRWASCTPRHMNGAIQQARLTYGVGDVSDDCHLAQMTWQLYTGGHGPFFPGMGISSPGVEETEPSPLGDRIPRFTAETLHHLAGQPDDGPLTWQPP